MSNEEMAKKHFELGMDYFEKKNYSKTIEELNKAISYDPQNKNAILAINTGLGYAYQFNENYEQAIIYFTKLLKIQPSMSFLLARGSTYCLKGDLDLGIADFELAIQIDPNNEEARKKLNITRQRRGY